MSESNGTTPATTAPATDDCVNCATRGEKALAVFALLFAIFLGVMAADMFTGGRVSGVVMREREKAAT